MHNGDYHIMVATSSENVLDTFEVKVREKQLVYCEELRKLCVNA